MSKILFYTFEKEKKDLNVPPATPAAPAATPAPVDAKSAEAKKADDLKPQVFEKNEKEKMIAEGQIKRNKHDYPTFDDVISDWETEDDGEGGKKKKKKTDKKDGDGKDDAKKDEKKEAKKDDEKKSEKTKSKMTEGGGEKKSEKK
uniref:Uncharacterized protein n=1 Tax=Panagrolaimus sp. ES5 TaxID=591445 RepID=A0AC34FTG8_9BILA